MKVEINKNSVKVIRESNDKKIYKESTFYYYVKNILINMGYNVVRAQMNKEQMTSNPFYIRSRNWLKQDEDYPAIYFDSYALRFVYEDYNNGEVMLTLDGDLELAKFKNDTEKDRVMTGLMFNLNQRKNKA